MDQKLYPGAIVRFESGEIGLVEKVEIIAQVQMIKSRPYKEGQVMDSTHPVYMTLKGDVNSPNLRTPQLTVIATAGDTGIEPKEI